jgi:protein-disulfide isomerase
VLPVWSYLGAVLCTLIALTAAGALVFQHLSGKALPGCRAGGDGSMTASAEPVSACATLEAHPMGSLGGMRLWWEARSAGQSLDKITPEQAVLPVSMLGAAYFAAALAALVVVGVRGRRVGGLVAWGWRLGAAVSVGYLVAIVVSEKYCWYCITTHAANLLLVGILEVGMLLSGRASGRREAGWSAVAAAVGVLALTGGTLGVMDTQKREQAAQLARAEADQAAEAMKAKAERDRAAAAAAAQGANAGGAATPARLPWADRGFTGRWIYGPRNAPVRVVGFSSYECPYCRVIEGELLALVEKYPGKISVSHMHFPMSNLCNKHANTNMHPNSCWAARAAEAAGIIAGSRAALEGKDQQEAANEAFWKFHKWLFSRGGKFTTEELTAALPGLGFADTNQFITVMTGPAAVKGIESDTDAADLLGLQETPMLYVNGVELRGWQQPGAVTRTIEALVKADPPAVGPEADKPMLAAEKFVEDWRQERVISAPDLPERTMGPADAKVRVIVWGDYTEPNTKRVHEKLKELVKDRSVSYSFRHFPGARACNPALAQLNRDLFPSGCLAARAAEAAGSVGGRDGFWRMTDWLFDNRDGLSDQRVRAGAVALGLDGAKFDAAMAEGGAAGTALAAQVAHAQSINIDRMPKIFVQDKWVRQWISEDQKDVVLERIINDALSTPAP